MKWNIFSTEFILLGHKINFLPSKIANLRPEFSSPKISLGFFYNPILGACFPFGEARSESVAKNEKVLRLGWTPFPSSLRAARSLGTFSARLKFWLRWRGRDIIN